MHVERTRWRRGRGGEHQGRELLQGWGRPEGYGQKTHIEVTLSQRQSNNAAAPHRNTCIAASQCPRKQSIFLSNSIVPMADSSQAEAILRVSASCRSREAATAAFEQRPRAASAARPKPFSRGRHPCSRWPSAEAEAEAEAEKQEDGEGNEEKDCGPETTLDTHGYGSSPMDHGHTCSRRGRPGRRKRRTQQDRGGGRQRPGGGGQRRRRTGDGEWSGASGELAVGSLPLDTSLPRGARQGRRTDRGKRPKGNVCVPPRRQLVASRPPSRRCCEGCRRQRLRQCLRLEAEFILQSQRLGEEGKRRLPSSATVLWSEPAERKREEVNLPWAPHHRVGARTAASPFQGPGLSAPASPTGRTRPWGSRTAERPGTRPCCRPRRRRWWGPGRRRTCR
ncbi:unnamed protein product [Prorocentrum cordatum]|uniref:Uncharacterized protein n=1 Tax=Prorocentrum cordatum TaxID=2364126 RepID=A0ABN9X4N2_9DINO|nr:unnamed protein product [Polarella glacialis]